MARKVKPILQYQTQAGLKSILDLNDQVEHLLACLICEKSEFDTGLTLRLIFRFMLITGHRQLHFEKCEDDLDKHKESSQI